MTAAPPLVSIVVPSYNMAEYVAETIDSVLDQDYPAVELIVLDDGSTDETRAVLEKYAGRIYWESQQNMGQVETLTKGWRIAKGEILGFISADDYLLPGAVAKAVEVLRANRDAVLCYCDFVLIDGESHVIRTVRTPDFDYDEMVLKFVCPPGPGAFFRRSAYARTGPLNKAARVMLDYDYWVRLGLLGPFVRIPEVLAAYRVHETSQTFGGFDESKAAEPVEIIMRLYASGALPARLQAREDEALANAYLVSSQLNFRAGRVRAGFRQLDRAWRHYPRALFSRKAVRLALNVVFNRLGHRLLWRMREIGLGPRSVAQPKGIGKP
jgi:glycosyltransferase involved in cell wall biosynthesis